MFVGHDILAAAINSLECAQKADEVNGAVRVCTIQASKVVETGNLLGSSKTIDNTHWSYYYNNHPHLLNIDVQVMSHFIPDSTGGPLNARNQVHAAHILYSTENEKAVNI